MKMERNLVNKDGKPYVVAVIPAFNEEKSIAKVLLLVKKYVDLVIVGDDGSDDMTGEIARALGAIVIRNDRNMGKGYTLKRLFNEALKLGADIIVALDADGQHDPNYIPKLIEPIINGEADIVIGSRYRGVPPDGIPLYRKIGLKIIGLLHKPAIKGVRDTQSGYRAYNRRVVEALAKKIQTRGYGTETEQLYIARKYNWRIVEIPITVTYAVRNPSKRHPLKHGMEIIGGLLRIVIEERPLLLLGVPGTILLLIGLGAAIYVAWLFNQTRYFSIPVTLIALGFTFVGSMIIIAAMILYAIARMRGFSI